MTQHTAPVFGSQEHCQSVEGSTLSRLISGAPGCSRSCDSWEKKSKLSAEFSFHAFCEHFLPTC